MQYNLNPIARAIGKKPEAFTKADIIKYILDNDIHELNFRYTGADGHLKVLNFVIQDADYLDEVLSSGERVDGSSLFPGLMEAGSSDLYVVPQFASAFMDPFAAQPTISFCCAYMDKNGQPLSAAPDEILRRAAQAFRDVTGGLEFYAMGELEYYVIGEKEDGYEAVDQRGYHEMAPFSKQIDFRTQAMRLICECGGQIKYGHGEVGNFSTEDLNYEQNEIEFLPVPVEQAAQHLQLGKWILFELGWRMGLKVTFAPKIIVGKAGSGMHVHTKIVDKNGINQYVDKAGQLTATAHKAVAGMMSLAASLTAFGNTNPTSYLRLVPHQEAPTTVCWGDRNRSALVRVPLGWSADVDMCSIINPLEHGFEIYNAEQLAKDTYVAVNIHKDEFAGTVAHLDSLPASCVASAERLRQHRAIYEARGVFDPVTIDMLIRNLEAYQDADLRAKAQADPKFLKELVDRYFYC